MDHVHRLLDPFLEQLQLPLSYLPALTPFTFWASLAAVIVVRTLTKGMFPGRKHFPVAGRTVVVTGGSQGMGKQLAILLAAKGANVVIVARTVSKLKAALKEIEVCYTFQSISIYIYIYQRCVESRR
jgi:3-dehydrosphinganine reductase